jgi:hypothetical protein
VTEPTGSDQPDAQALWELLARSAFEPTLRQRLLADPATVLREHGIAFGEAVEVRVLENTAAAVHLVLPAFVDASELSEAQLAAVAGGTGVLPAGSDEVSAAIAGLFASHGQAYQALSAQAGALHSQFVQTMNGAGGHP